MVQTFKHSNSSGFTLVELAISLMIIGILLGGVLKGQELIENARITNVVQQVNAYKTAIATFQASYRSLPGDIANPSTRLPNCTTAPCNATGNADRYMDPTFSIPYNLGGGNIALFAVNYPESRNFFLHMFKAGVISGGVDADGSSPPTPYEWNYTLPGSKFPNTGFMAMGVVMDNSTAWAPIRRSNWLALFNNTSGYAIMAPRAAAMDRKMDDGKPYSGNVIQGWDGVCALTATRGSDYRDTDKLSGCNVFFSMGL